MADPRHLVEGPSSIELGSSVSPGAREPLKASSLAGCSRQAHAPLQSTHAYIRRPSRTRPALYQTEELTATTESRNVARHHQHTPGSPSTLQQLYRWWSENVLLSLDHLPESAANNSDPRDYLALERTFLAYMRTSVALVSFGVVLLQLFLLKNVNKTTGICLGAITYGAGSLVLTLGCRRYFVEQKALERGKAFVGGWDLFGMGVLFFGVVAAVLIVVLVES